MYCFQEEWDREKFIEGVAKTIPADGKQIEFVWSGGCAIASTHKLFRLPMKLDRAVAGLVIPVFSIGTPVVVISAHFKCCGYAGSQEDMLRIQQAEQIVHEIKRLERGDFGEVAMRAPIVLIGDYNLVGSRKPLDVINAAGLKDVHCTASDNSVHTWRGLKPDVSFWPGRLDLVSTRGFESVTGRIYDSKKVDQNESKFEHEDSEASDHLMIVLDCNE